MFKRYIISIIILLISITLVSAVDDQGTTNDPTINDRANACYEDGSLASKCDTTWEWQCGWYLIRFEYGLINRGNFVEVCSTLLPPLPPTPEPVVNVSPTTMPPITPTEPSGGCIEGSMSEWIDFGGGYFLADGSPTYSETTCTTPTGFTLAVDVVFAPAPFDPLELCNRNGIYTSTTTLDNDVYGCDP